MSLAPRVMVKFPSGSTWASTNDWDGHLDLVASREFGQSVELTGIAGGVLRGDSDEFRVSDGVTWGLGAHVPDRSPLRALVEWQGEFVIKDNTAGHQPAVRRRGRQHRADAQPASPIRRTSRSAASGRRRTGSSCTAACNYSFGTGGRVVGGLDIDHSAWGFDLRVGWHPGVTPRAQRVRRHQGDDDGHQHGDAPPAPPPPPRRAEPAADGHGSPATRACVEPGQTSQLRGTATDPDGDPLTYRWTRAGGTFSPTDAPNTTWTAPQTRKARSP